MQMDVDIGDENLRAVVDDEGSNTPVTDSLRGILQGSYDMEREKQLALEKKYAAFS